MFCPHIVYLRLIRFSKQIAITSFNSTNWLVFMIKTKCAHYVVWTWSQNKLKVNLPFAFPLHFRTGRIYWNMSRKFQIRLKSVKNIGSSLDTYKSLRKHLNKFFLEWYTFLITVWMQKTKTHFMSDTIFRDNFKKYSTAKQATDDTT
jgi:hypothetical protein